MEQKKPLKRSKVGLEIEMMTLDYNGNVISGADILIKKMKKKYPKSYIMKECAKNMVEIASFPSLRVQNASLDLLNQFEHLLEIAEKNDMILFPLATYPGKFNPDMRTGSMYGLKKKMFGPQKFLHAGRCIGFHCHYTLPKGVYDNEHKFIKKLVRSKLKQTMISGYNFLIAADPALTTLMQCSPYYQGKYYGKDSRMIWYRGGKKLKNMDGLYANMQQIGGLQPYKQTGTDLILSIRKRYHRWAKEMKKVGVDTNLIANYPSILTVAWNPVKINPHGTFEQRGMDMNHPKYLFGASVLIKFTLKKIVNEFLHVVPSDIGLEEPFKLEGNILYIPPQTHVRNKLQYYSAYQGFDNKEITKYCNRFMRFAKSCMNDRYKPTLKKLVSLLDRERSVSDVILSRAKKMGFGKNDPLTKEAAAEIALKSSSQLYKQLEETRKNIEDLD